MSRHVQKLKCETCLPTVGADCSKQPICSAAFFFNIVKSVRLFCVSATLEVRSLSTLITHLLSCCMCVYSVVAALLIVLSQPVTRASSIKEMTTNASEDESETAVQGSCPPWFIRDSRSKCVCHSLLGIAECCSEASRLPCYPNTSVMTLPCYCMTVDMVTNITYAGHCPYTCFEFHHAIWNVDPEVLNNRTCSLWNRAGLLCEDCQEGYGLPLFSYDLHCVECSSQDLVHNVLLIVLYFFSLTLFCLLVIVCRISAARPPLSTFVLVSQIYSAPFELQAISREKYNVGWKVFEMFYGFWNLNIFRPLYHSLCLSPRMSNLQAATLQYSIGFYPLLLLALILALVRLRDSGCRGIVRICRSIHWCLAHFRKNFNIHSSLTDAFSTFIILSYIKIGYTSLSRQESTNQTAPITGTCMQSPPEHTFMASIFSFALQLLQLL